MSTGAIKHTFWALVAIDAVLAAILGNHVTTDSDPAGNAMANGFAVILMLAAFALLGLLSLIFALVRSVAIRYVLIALVLAFGLFLSVLALAQYG